MRYAFELNSLLIASSATLPNVVPLFNINQKNKKTKIMLRWTIIFIVIAIIAGILGFGGIAGGAAGIAKIFFFIFIVLFILSLLKGGLKK